MFKVKYLLRIKDGQMGFEMHGSGSCRNLRSRDVDTAPGEMLYAYMVLRNKNQRNVTVYASEKCIVGRNWRDGLIVGIVDPDAEGIPAAVHQRADIENEGRISSFVVAGVRAVYIKVQLLVGTLETDIHPLAGKVIVDYDVFFVPGSPAPVSGSLVTAVGGIPGMGDGYCLKRVLPFLMECPLIINAPLVSRSRRCTQADKKRKKRNK